MPLIGVRELRERTAEVLRHVREDKAEYIITHQGKPVAVLLPVDAEALEDAMVQAGRRSTGAAWQNYLRVVEQVRRRWPAGQKTQDLLDEVRD